MTFRTTSLRSVRREVSMPSGRLVVASLMSVRKASRFDSASRPSGSSERLSAKMDEQNVRKCLDRTSVSPKGIRQIKALFHHANYDWNAV